MYLIIAIFIAAVPGWPGVDQALPAVLYVSPSGRDANPGTEDKPLASLEGARDTIRELRKARGLPAGGVTVRLRGGVYLRSMSFQLLREDSGTEAAPISYSAYPGEKVILRGGLPIDPQSLTPVSDAGVAERIISTEARSEVRQVDLRTLGIRELDPIPARGFSQPIRPAPLELFIDGRAMTLACWPNEGFARTGGVIDPGSRPRFDEKPDRPGVFTYEGDRPAHWTNAEDLWLYGYWKHDWADESIPVAEINPQQKRVTLTAPHTYGIEKGRPFRAENLLEELDRPGEYYVDRRQLMLYLWPPDMKPDGDVVVSTLPEPIIELSDVAHVRIEGLVIETSRGDGIQINGGAECLVAGCTLRNLGNRAIVVEGGRRHIVRDCDVYQTGEGGIVLNGGQRGLLIPAAHAALNNHIHHFSRRTTTYRPAVRIAGVGQRVAHNRIHDAPHAAILFSGNDHLIEYNEIHDVLTRTGDGGAIYTGRDWTARGTIIRYNLLHHLHGEHKWENAIYLDDQASGIIVTGNIIHDCHWGMLIGGGRDNVIENNVFSNCRLALHFDARGLGWAKESCGGALRAGLGSVPYEEEPWRSRYPALVGILADEPFAPKGNVVRRNVLVRSGRIDADMDARVKQYGLVADNLATEEDPGFASADELDFRLKDDATLGEVLPRFERIPVDRIGLQTSDYRKTATGRGAPE